MKNNVKYISYILVYIIGYFLSVKLISDYPISKEDIAQNFYIVVYFVKNIYVIFGMGLIIYIINKIKC